MQHRINKKTSQPDLPPLPQPPKKTPLPTTRVPPCFILSTESPYWDAYCPEYDKEMVKHVRRAYREKHPDGLGMPDIERYRVDTPDLAIPPPGPPNPVPTGPHMPLWGLVLIVILSVLLLALIFEEWMI